MNLYVEVIESVVQFQVKRPTRFLYGKIVVHLSVEEIPDIEADHKFLSRKEITESCILDELAGHLEILNIEPGGLEALHETETVMKVELRLFLQEVEEGVLHRTVEGKPGFIGHLLPIIVELISTSIMSHVEEGVEAGEVEQQAQLVTIGVVGSASMPTDCVLPRFSKGLVCIASFRRGLI